MCPVLNILEVEMTIKTKSELIAAMVANPTMRLRWNLYSTGKRGQYEFNNETVLTRAAEAVIMSGCVIERRLPDPWNRRVWWFNGAD